MPTRACTHGCVGLRISSMSSCQQTTFVGMGRSPNNTKPLRTPPGSPTNAGTPARLHGHLSMPQVSSSPSRWHATPHASATSSPRIEKSASQPGVVVHRFQAAAFTPPASRSSTTLIGRQFMGNRPCRFSLLLAVSSPVKCCLWAIYRLV